MAIPEKKISIQSYFMGFYLISSIITSAIFSLITIVTVPVLFSKINGFLIVMISAVVTIYSSYLANKKILTGKKRFFTDKELNLLTKVSILLVSFTQLLFIILWFFVLHQYSAPMVQSFLEWPAHHFSSLVAIYFIINFIQFLSVRIMSEQYVP